MLYKILFYNISIVHFPYHAFSILFVVSTMSIFVECIIFSCNYICNWNGAVLGCTYYYAKGPGFQSYNRQFEESVTSTIWRAFRKAMANHQEYSEPMFRKQIMNFERNDSSTKREYHSLNYHI